MAWGLIFADQIRSLPWGESSVYSFFLLEKIEQNKKHFAESKEEMMFLKGQNFSFYQ